MMQMLQFTDSKRRKKQGGWKGIEGFDSMFSWAMAGSIMPAQFLTDIYLICFLSTSVREIPEIPLSICSLFNYPSCKDRIFLSSESNCFCCYQYSRLLK